ncbi:MAG: cohesin domain-containing protein [bacterium]|nr:cohesin domain-containing protein [bacterium]
MGINILKNTGLALAIFFLVFFASAPKAEAATLSVGPTSGTFTVGSTFDVSLYLNTEGQSVNTLGIEMSFSPDKLQLVSPSAGKSIISVWAAPPKFNNQSGRIELQGGIPGGVNVSNGLITTLTFRVKSVGTSVLKFLDASRVLLNDGLGTDALKDTSSGIYQLILPPPAGPLVISETHPDQGKWYSNSSVALQWALDEGAEGYSYILNKEPVGLLDNISEGQQTSVTYTNISDGISYFHVKALRGGSWGGATHFSLQIDSTPPAEFPVDILPSAKTTRKQPVVQFSSTDAHSGIDHYELKIVPLSLQVPAGDGDSSSQPLFIEAHSPHVLSPLELGKYDVIVRAYDGAGNYRETTKRLSIVTAAFEFIGDKGFEIKNVVFIPWLWFFLGALTLVMMLIFSAWRIRRWHHAVVVKRQQKALPQEVEQKLEELRRYKSKYGPGALLLLIALCCSVFASGQALAQQIELSPPLITAVSRDISNEEIFYAGGKTEIPQSQVILYLQNLQTAETVSETLESDKNGDWFYRHHAFLPAGNYLLWAQGKINEQLSPPSPQVQLSVKTTAIQFGASRLSFEILLLMAIGALALFILVLVFYIIFHAYHGRKKHAHFLKEVREAEESVRRGFAVLRRDIQAEFDIFKKIKLDKAISQEEKLREEQLVKDLQEVEQYIGKEIWDIEASEYVK